MKHWLITICLILVVGTTMAQQQYWDTRVLQYHNPNVLPKRTLDFRVAHRFGDMFGDNGGISTFYGLDNAPDIRIGFEYGLTDKISIGATRMKGAYARKQLFEGYFKYQYFKKEKWSLASVHMAVVSAMKSSVSPESVTYFNENGLGRLNYLNGVLGSYRISPKAIAFANLYHIHRNRVLFSENNTQFAFAAGLQIPVSHVLNISFEAGAPFDNVSTETVAWNLGLEIDTGGHLFQIDLGSSSATGDFQMLTSTNEEWYNGAFRLGFTISRPFKL